MELTPDEQTLLVDKEMEAYRAELRSKQKYGARPERTQSEETAAPHRASKMWQALGGILFVIVAILLINVIGQRSGDSSRTTESRDVPGKQTVALGQIIMKAGGYVYYKIQITPGMQEATVAGSFKVSGGSQNAISAIVADESGYYSWVNGREARLIWETPAPTSDGTIDVHLDPGTYFFALSNRLAPLSEKRVSLDVKLTYKRLEKSILNGNRGR